MTIVSEIDADKSERGRQRRRAGEGPGAPLLHCCCICHTVAPWGDGWSTYCSEGDIDDSVAVPKFCSRLCAEKGGPRARNVTKAMREAARDLEWRESRIVYREREMTEREKWQEAVRRQSFHRRRL